MTKKLYKSIFTTSWAVVCMIVFMLFSARISIVHGSLLENPFSIFARAAEVHFADYAADLLRSFLGILAFSLSLVMTGTFPLSSLLREEVRSNITKSIPALVGSSFVAGHWIISSTFLLLAALDLLTPKIVAWTLLLWGLPGLYSTVQLFQNFIADQEHRKGDNMHDGDYRSLYWFSISIFLASLLYSTSRLSYDSVALYFSDAKLIALTRHINFFQDNAFLISSLQTGIQFSAIIQLFGDQSARMFSWVSGIVVLIFSLAIAEKVGLPSRSKGVLMTLLMTSTAFIDLLGDGKVDLTSSAVALAAVYWLLDDRKTTHKLLAGFFAGLAMASRPYNVFIMSVFLVSFYIQKLFLTRMGSERFGIGQFIKAMFWISLGAALPLAFHLLQNWLVYDNPLAILTDARMMTVENWQWAFDPKYIWLMRFMYPFVVTFLNTPQSIGNISPIVLAFLPNLFFRGLRKKLHLSPLLIDLLTAALITLLLWMILFFTIMEIRYIFFLWVIFFIAVSQLVVLVLEEYENIFRVIMSSFLITLLAFTFLRIIYFSLDTYTPMDHQGNILCQEFIYCDYLKPINDKAQPGERVLSLLAFRYYLRSDLFACSTQTDEYQALRNASLQNQDEFWNEVYRQGYSYIAYEKNYSVRHILMKFVPSPENAPSWMDLESIYGNPGDLVVAYKIKVHEPPILRAKNCVQNESGIWEVQTLLP